MAIVAGLFAGLFGRLLGRRKGAVAAVIAIALYTVLVGANAAVVRALLEADLLDELTLLIHPVIVGSCKRLFKDKRALKRMQLVNSKITGSGVAILTYQPRRNALFRFGMSPGVGGRRITSHSGSAGEYWDAAMSHRVIPTYLNHIVGLKCGCYH